MISTNRPARSIPFHGGVVLIDLVGRAPSNNSITSNELIRNRPNVFYDGSGHGNDLTGNHCVPTCYDRTATSPLMRGWVRSIA